MTNLQSLLGQRVTAALSRPLPALTRRDVRLPQVPGKALAVIGVRRAGKTSFMWQCLADRLAAGRPREALVLLGLEDDRLAGLTVADLDWAIELIRTRMTAAGVTAPLTLCLDEVQVVPGWERLARRLVDEGDVELLLSGSSAKLLSREVATALRGRGLEALVHPFSFRESLRHAGVEPASDVRDLAVPERAELGVRLERYLVEGGFPEAQGLNAADRAQLLTSYVDVVVLRDVIERHAVSNPQALRWLQRQLLGNAGGSFSVQKMYGTLRSQGLPVAKDTLHEYLGHLEDTFLVRTVPIHSRSPKRRMVNPRKAYPVDMGLIALYATTNEPETGHALETAVLLELERRGYSSAYVRTEDDHEVDFLASAPGRQPQLVQVAASVRDPATLEREVRALAQAVNEHPKAEAVLVTMDAETPSVELPRGVRWAGAAEWLLEMGERRPSTATG